MYAKLLKKTRKRYSVTRIDELATDACWYLTECERELGLPFYLLEDNRFWFPNGDVAYENLDDALSSIRYRVFKEYELKLRGKPQVSTKVWYNK